MTTPYESPTSGSNSKTPERDYPITNRIWTMIEERHGIRLSVVAISEMMELELQMNESIKRAKDWEEVAEGLAKELKDAHPYISDSAYWLQHERATYDKEAALSKYEALKKEPKP